MDPNACWLEIMDASSPSTPEERRFLAGCLTDWIRTGGFLPRTLSWMGRKSAIAVCQALEQSSDG